MKKAVFFDIDGTLISCMDGMFEISEEVKSAIRELQKNGNYAFVATGRPYALLSKDMLNFGFDGFILANGAHVIIDNKTIYSESIDKNFIKTLTQELDNNKIQYILQGELYSYLDKSCKDFYDYYDKIGVSKEYLKEDYDIENVDTLKIEMLCKDDNEVDLCLSLIKDNPECDHFSSVNKKAVEVYIKKNTKSKAIEIITNHLGISIENTYAFGDGKNDIDMLKYVGCGIAMDNSSDAVKMNSDYITNSVYDDGVAKGIKNIVLK